MQCLLEQWMKEQLLCLRLSTFQQSMWYFGGAAIGEVHHRMMEISIACHLAVFFFDDLKDNFDAALKDLFL